MNAMAVRIFMDEIFLILLLVNYDKVSTGKRVTFQEFLFNINKLIPDMIKTVRY